MAELKQIIRVANTDLKGQTTIYHALRKIKGISFMMANAICSVAKVNKRKKAGDLSESEVDALNKVIASPLGNGLPIWMLNRRKDYEEGDDKHLITGELDFVKSNDIKRLKMIKSYRGLRHAWGLPVRGQRTKSNFRKNKGKAAAGTGKKVKEKK